MSQFKFFLAVGLFFGGSLLAQQSHLYAYAAPGGISVAGETGKVLYGGLGGEAIVHPGFGLGLEGVVVRQVSAGWHGLFPMISTNFYYHFVHFQDRMDPFVTVGYTAAFRGAHHEAGQDPGEANLINFGGGFNYWFRPRTGVKIEFRDHLRPSRGPNANYWSFRIGLTFH